MFLRPSNSIPQLDLTLKRYFTFPKDPGLEPCHEIVYCHIRTLVGGGGLTLLQRCSRRILQPQPTRLKYYWQNIERIYIQNRRKKTFIWGIQQYSGVLRYEYNSKILDFIYITKNTGRLLNLESFETTILLNKHHLFEIVCFHRLYIYIYIYIYIYVCVCVCVCVCENEWENG